MRVSASPEYMGQEEVREALQNVVEERISDGRIRDQAGLDEFWKTIEKAALALRSIPFDVLVKVTTVREIRELVHNVLVDIENTPAV